MMREPSPSWSDRRTAVGAGGQCVLRRVGDTLAAPLVPTLTAEQVHQAALRAQAQRQGWPLWPAHASPVAQGPLARYAWSGPMGQLQGWVQVADWAEQWCPDLPGLAWSELDQTSVAALLGTAPQLGPAWAEMDGQLLQWCPQGALLPEGPVLQAARGPVWLQALEVVAPPLRRWPVSRLPVALQLTQGRWSQDQWRRLQAGDVLRLPPLRGQARLAGHPLFTFEFTPEAVTVTDIYDTPSAPSSLPVEAASAPGQTLALQHLPLSVAVVLPGLELSLEALAQLQAGATLALPTDAHRQLSLELEGQCVARAELVQLDDGLGVQLTAVLVAA